LRKTLLAIIVLAVTAWLGLAAAPAALAQPYPYCGQTGTPPPVQHVILVMAENQSYSQILDGGSMSANAPFQNELAASCGSALDFFGLTHTSAANYIGVSAGQYPPQAPPGCGSVPACSNTYPNLYSQLAGAGLTWGAFVESMPTACDPKSGGTNTKAHDLYSVGHNPVVFFSDLTAAQCQAGDVGVPSLTAASGPFYTDLENQTLPSFSLVVPNTIDDSEGPDSKAVNEQVSDAWLGAFTALVTASPSYQAGNTLLIISYDEGSASFKDYAVGENCANEAADLPLGGKAGDVSPQESCHLPALVVYPYTPAGSTDSTFFTMYSVTATVEQLFGLPLLANAAAANSMAGHFGIPADPPAVRHPWRHHHRHARHA
jgi:phosphatidylinositol-3-phosphatase